MIKTSQLQKIINYCQEEPEIEAVFLFGSKAKDKDNKDSDIDLAVLFKDTKVNLFRLQGELTEELKNILRAKVDIVNMNASDTVFNYRVLSEGRLIYQTDKDRMDNFKIDLGKRYFDLKPSYDFYYQELSHRARSGLIGAI